MIEGELKKAFTTLTEALTMTESQISEEIVSIQQQIAELKDRIVQLNGQQQTLSHDRESVSEMYNRYCDTEYSAEKVEF